MPGAVLSCPRSVVNVPTTVSEPGLSHPYRQRVDHAITVRI